MSAKILSDVAYFDFKICYNILHAPLWCDLVSKSFNAEIIRNVNLWILLPSENVLSKYEIEFKSKLDIQVGSGKGSNLTTYVLK
jgi:hypothetical protein